MLSMVNQRRTKWLIAIFLSLLAFKSIASSVHFVTENLPPFQYVKEGKLTGGAMIELIEALIKEAKITATIDAYPWPRAYSIAIHQPNTLIFSMRKSASREKLFHWVGHLYTLRTQIAILSKRTDIKIKELEDINNYSIGVVRGDYDQLLLQHLGVADKMYQGLSYKELWQMLGKERLDSIMTNPHTAKLMMKELNIDKEEITIPFVFDSTKDHLFLAANKQTEPLIIKKLTQALETLKANGTYQAILTKWQL